MSLSPTLTSLISQLKSTTNHQQCTLLASQVRVSLETDLLNSTNDTTLASIAGTILDLLNTQHTSGSQPTTRETSDRITGLYIIISLLDLRNEYLEILSTRFAHCFSTLFRTNAVNLTDSVISLAAFALSKYSQVGGTLSIDFISTVLEDALNWLAANPQKSTDRRRLLAVVVLSSLITTTVGSLFLQHVDTFFSNIWYAIRDSTPSTRVRAVDLLSTVLHDLAKRLPLNKHIYTIKIYYKVIEILKLYNAQHGLGQIKIVNEDFQFYLGHYGGDFYQKLTQSMTNSAVTTQNASNLTINSNAVHGALLVIDVLLHYYDTNSHNVQNVGQNDVVSTRNNDPTAISITPSPNRLLFLSDSDQHEDKKSTTTGTNKLGRDGENNKKKEVQLPQNSAIQLTPHQQEFYVDIPSFSPLVYFFDEIMAYLFIHIESKHPFIVSQILSLLPHTASLNTPSFTSALLPRTISRVLTFIQKNSPHKEQSFITIGEITTVVGHNIIAYLPAIMHEIHRSLNLDRDQLRNRVVPTAVLKCITLLCKPLGNLLFPSMERLLSKLLSLGLSPLLTSTLTALSNSIQPLLPLIQERLLETISLVLVIPLIPSSLTKHIIALAAVTSNMSTSPFSFQSQGGQNTQGAGLKDENSAQTGISTGYATNLNILLSTGNPATLPLVPTLTHRLALVLYAKQRFLSWSTSSSGPNTPQNPSQSISAPQFRIDNDLILLALHTLATFPFNPRGYRLFFLVKDIIVKYLNLQFPVNLRLSAACTLSTLLPILLTNFTSASSKKILIELLKRLIVTIIHDPSASVRTTVLSLLDDSLLIYLSQSELSQVLLLGLNDEVQRVREMSVRLLGKISQYNPTTTYPTLRNYLSQLLSQLIHLPQTSIESENHVKLLGLMIDHCPSLIKSSLGNVIGILLTRLPLHCLNISHESLHSLLLPINPVIVQMLFKDTAIQHWQRLLESMLNNPTSTDNTEHNEQLPPHINNATTTQQLDLNGTQNNSTIIIYNILTNYFQSTTTTATSSIVLHSDSKKMGTTGNSYGYGAGSDKTNNTNYISPYILSTLGKLSTITPPYFAPIYELLLPFISAITTEGLLDFNANTGHITSHYSTQTSLSNSQTSFSSPSTTLVSQQFMTHNTSKLPAIPTPNNAILPYKVVQLYFAPNFTNRFSPLHSVLISKHSVALQTLYQFIMKSTNLLHYIISTPQTFYNHYALFLSYSKFFPLSLQPHTLPFGPQNQNHTSISEPPQNDLLTVNSAQMNAHPAFSHQTEQNSALLHSQHNSILGDLARIIGLTGVLEPRLYALILAGFSMQLVNKNTAIALVPPENMSNNIIFSTNPLLNVHKGKSLGKWAIQYENNNIYNIDFFSMTTTGDLTKSSGTHRHRYQSTSNLLTYSAPTQYTSSENTTTQYNQQNNIILEKGKRPEISPQSLSIIQQTATENNHILINFNDTHDPDLESLNTLTENRFSEEHSNNHTRSTLSTLSSPTSTTSSSQMHTNHTGITLQAHLSDLSSISTLQSLQQLKSLLIDTLFINEDHFLVDSESSGGSGNGQSSLINGNPPLFYSKIALSELLDLICDVNFTSLHTNALSAIKFIVTNNSNYYSPLVHANNNNLHYYVGRLLPRMLIATLQCDYSLKDVFFQHLYGILFASKLYLLPFVTQLVEMVLLQWVELDIIIANYRESRLNKSLSSNSGENALNIDKRALIILDTINKQTIINNNQTGSNFASSSQTTPSHHQSTNPSSQLYYGTTNTSSSSGSGSGKESTTSMGGNGLNEENLYQYQQQILLHIFNIITLLSQVLGTKFTVYSKPMIGKLLTILTSTTHLPRSLFSIPSISSTQPTPSTSTTSTSSNQAQQRNFGQMSPFTTIPTYSPIIVSAALTTLRSIILNSGLVDQLQIVLTTLLSSYYHGSDPIDISIGYGTTIFSTPHLDLNFLSSTPGSNLTSNALASPSSTSNINTINPMVLTALNSHFDGYSSSETPSPALLLQSAQIQHQKSLLMSVQSYSDDVSSTSLANQSGSTNQTTVINVPPPSQTPLRNVNYTNPFFPLYSTVPTRDNLYPTITQSTGLSGLTANISTSFANQSHGNQHHFLNQILTSQLVQQQHPFVRLMTVQNINLLTVSNEILQHTSSLVLPLARTLNTPNILLYPDSLALLNSIIYQIGPTFLIYEPLFKPIIAKIQSNLGIILQQQQHVVDYVIQCATVYFPGVNVVQGKDYVSLTLENDPASNQFSPLNASGNQTNQNAHGGQKGQNAHSTTSNSSQFPSTANLPLGTGLNVNSINGVGGNGQVVYIPSMNAIPKLLAVLEYHLESLHTLSVGVRQPISSQGMLVPTDKSNQSGQSGLYGGQFTVSDVLPWIRDIWSICYVNSAKSGPFDADTTGTAQNNASTENNTQSVQTSGANSSQNTASQPSPNIPKAGDPNLLSAHNMDLQLEVQTTQLQKLCQVDTNITGEDWVVWFRELSLEVLRQSSSPSLRACSGLAAIHPPIALNLFYASFLSCYHEVSDFLLDSFVTCLSFAIHSSELPKQVGLCILYLAEFCILNDIQLPLELSHVAHLAKKCDDLPRQLFFLEQQHYLGMWSNRDPPTAKETLGLNAGLMTYEAASNFASSMSFIGMGQIDPYSGQYDSTGGQRGARSNTHAVGSQNNPQMNQIQSTTPQSTQTQKPPPSLLTHSNFYDPSEFSTRLMDVEELLEVTRGLGLLDYSNGLLVCAEKTLLEEQRCLRIQNLTAAGQHNFLSNQVNTFNNPNANNGGGNSTQGNTNGPNVSSNNTTNPGPNELVNYYVTAGGQPQPGSVHGSVQSSAHSQSGRQGQGQGGGLNNNPQNVAHVSSNPVPGSQSSSIHGSQHPRGTSSTPKSKSIQGSGHGQHGVPHQPNQSNQHQHNNSNLPHSSSNSHLSPTLHTNFAANSNTYHNYSQNPLFLQWKEDLGHWSTTLAFHTTSQLLDPYNLIAILGRIRAFHGLSDWTALTTLTTTTWNKLMQSPSQFAISLYDQFSLPLYTVTNATNAKIAGFGANSTSSQNQPNSPFSPQFSPFLGHNSTQSIHYANTTQIQPQTTHQRQLSDPNRPFIQQIITLLSQELILGTGKHSHLLNSIIPQHQHLLLTPQNVSQTVQHLVSHVNNHIIPYQTATYPSHQHSPQFPQFNSTYPQNQLQLLNMTNSNQNTNQYNQYNQNYQYNQNNNTFLSQPFVQHITPAQTNLITQSLITLTTLTTQMASIGSLVSLQTRSWPSLSKFANHLPTYTIDGLLYRTMSHIHNNNLSAASQLIDYTLHIVQASISQIIEKESQKLLTTLLQHQDTSSAHFSSLTSLTSANNQHKKLKYQDKTALPTRLSFKSLVQDPSDDPSLSSGITNTTNQLLSTIHGATGQYTISSVLTSMLFHHRQRRLNQSSQSTSNSISLTDSDPFGTPGNPSSSQHAISLIPQGLISPQIAAIINSQTLNNTTDIITHIQATNLGVYERLYPYLAHFQELLELYEVMQYKLVIASIMTNMITSNGTVGFGAQNGVNGPNLGVQVIDLTPKGAKSGHLAASTTYTGNSNPHALPNGAVAQQQGALHGAIANLVQPPTHLVPTTTPSQTPHFSSHPVPQSMSMLLIEQNSAQTLASQQQLAQAGQSSSPNLSQLPSSSGNAKDQLLATQLACNTKINTISRLWADRLHFIQTNNHHIWYRLFAIRSLVLDRYQLIPLFLSKFAFTNLYSTFISRPITLQSPPPFMVKGVFPLSYYKSPYYTAGAQPSQRNSATTNRSQNSINVQNTQNTQNAVQPGDQMQRQQIQSHSSQQAKLQTLIANAKARKAQNEIRNGNGKRAQIGHNSLIQRNNNNSLVTLSVRLINELLGIDCSVFVKDFLAIMPIREYPDVCFYSLLYLYYHTSYQYEAYVRLLELAIDDIFVDIAHDDNDNVHHGNVYTNIAAQSSQNSRNNNGIFASNQGYMDQHSNQHSGTSQSQYQNQNSANSKSDQLRTIPDDVSSDDDDYYTTTPTPNNNNNVNMNVQHHYQQGGKKSYQANFANTAANVTQYREYHSDLAKLHDISSFSLSPTGLVINQDHTLYTPHLPTHPQHYFTHQAINTHFYNQYSLYQFHNANNAQTPGSSQSRILSHLPGANSQTGQNSSSNTNLIAPKLKTQSPTELLLSNTTAYNQFKLLNFLPKFHKYNIYSADGGYHGHQHGDSGNPSSIHQLHQEWLYIEAISYLIDLSPVLPYSPTQHPSNHAPVQQQSTQKSHQHQGQHNSSQTRQTNIQNPNLFSQSIHQSHQSHSSTPQQSFHEIATHIPDPAISTISSSSSNHNPTLFYDNSGNILAAQGQTPPVQTTSHFSSYNTQTSSSQPQSHARLASQSASQNSPFLQKINATVQDISSKEVLDYITSRRIKFLQNPFPGPQLLQPAQTPSAQSSSSTLHPFDAFTGLSGHAAQQCSANGVSDGGNTNPNGSNCGSNPNYARHQTLSQLHQLNQRPTGVAGTGGQKCSRFTSNDLKRIHTDILFTLSLWRLHQMESLGKFYANQQATTSMSSSVPSVSLPTPQLNDLPTTTTNGNANANAQHNQAGQLIKSFEDAVVVQNVLSGDGHHYRGNNNNNNNAQYSHNNQNLDNSQSTSHTSSQLIAIPTATPATRHNSTNATNNNYISTPNGQNTALTTLSNYAPSYHSAELQFNSPVYTSQQQQHASTQFIQTGQNSTGSNSSEYNAMNVSNPYSNATFNPNLIGSGNGSLNTPNSQYYQIGHNFNANAINAQYGSGHNQYNANGTNNNNNALIPFNPAPFRQSAVTTLATLPLSHQTHHSTRTTLNDVLYYLSQALQHTTTNKSIISHWSILQYKLSLHSSKHQQDTYNQLLFYVNYGYPMYHNPLYSPAVLAQRQKQQKFATTHGNNGDNVHQHVITVVTSGGKYGRHGVDQDDALFSNHIKQYHYYHERLYFSHVDAVLKLQIKQKQQQQEESMMMMMRSSQQQQQQQQHQNQQQSMHVHHQRYMSTNSNTNQQGYIANPGNNNTNSPMLNNNARQFASPQQLPSLGQPDQGPTGPIPLQQQQQQQLQLPTTPSSSTPTQQTQPLGANANSAATATNTGYNPSSRVQMSTPQPMMNQQQQQQQQTPTQQYMAPNINSNDQIDQQVLEPLFPMKQQQQQQQTPLSSNLNLAQPGKGIAGSLLPTLSLGLTQPTRPLHQQSGNNNNMNNFPSNNNNPMNPINIAPLNQTAIMKNNIGLNQNMPQGQGSHMGQFVQDFPSNRLPTLPTLPTFQNPATPQQSQSRGQNTNTDGIMLPNPNFAPANSDGNNFNQHNQNYNQHYPNSQHFNQTGPGSTFGTQYNSAAIPITGGASLQSHFIQNGQNGQNQPNFNTIYPESPQNPHTIDFNTDPHFLYLLSQYQHAISLTTHYTATTLRSFFHTIYLSVYSPLYSPHIIQDILRIISLWVERGVPPLQPPLPYQILPSSRIQNQNNPSSTLPNPSDSSRAKTSTTPVQPSDFDVKIPFSIRHFSYFEQFARTQSTTTTSSSSSTLYNPRGPHAGDINKMMMQNDHLTQTVTHFNTQLNMIGSGHISHLNEYPPQGHGKNYQQQEQQQPQNQQHQMCSDPTTSPSYPPHPHQQLSTLPQHLLPPTQHELYIDYEIYRGINTIPLEIWLDVIPQLLARLNVSSTTLRQRIIYLLTLLTTTHPHAMLYSLSVTKSSCKGVENLYKKRNVNIILNTIIKTRPILLSQATLISNELIRISMLWTELWHDGLETAAKACFLHKSPKDMVKTVLPFHILFETEGPTTQKEYSFINLFGKDFELAFDVVKCICVLMQYRFYYEDVEIDSFIFSQIYTDPNVITKVSKDVQAHMVSSSSSSHAHPHGAMTDQNPNQGPNSAIFNNTSHLLSDPLSPQLHLLTPADQQALLDKYIAQAWEIYGAIHRRLDKNLRSQSTLLDLSQVSPQLLYAQHLEVILPGTYVLNSPLLLIMKFSPTLHILDSKQRPRTLQVLANDGLLYKYLLKGHEDLRQDERIMQVFGLINVLLLNNTQYQLYYDTSSASAEKDATSSKHGKNVGNAASLGGIGQFGTSPNPVGNGFGGNMFGTNNGNNRLDVAQFSDIMNRASASSLDPETQTSSNIINTMNSISAVLPTSTIVHQNEHYTYQKSNMFQNWNAFLFKQYYINSIITNSNESSVTNTNTTNGIPGDAVIGQNVTTVNPNAVQLSMQNIILSQQLTSTNNPNGNAQYTTLVDNADSSSINSTASSGDFNINTIINNVIAGNSIELWSPSHPLYPQQSLLFNSINGGVGKQTLTGGNGFETSNDDMVQHHADQNSWQNKTSTGSSANSASASVSSILKHPACQNNILTQPIFHTHYHGYYLHGHSSVPTSFGQQQQQQQPGDIGYSSQFNNSTAYGIGQQQQQQQQQQAYPIQSTTHYSTQLPQPRYYHSAIIAIPSATSTSSSTNNSSNNSQQSQTTSATTTTATILTHIKYHKLSIHRYNVIPLSPQCGLIEWVPNTDTMFALIKGYRDYRKVALTVEQRLMQLVTFPHQNDSALNFLPNIHRIEIVSYALYRTSGLDLHYALLMKSQHVHIWLQRRNVYTCSIAVMSQSGYLLGLGDRHPCNLMLNRDNGKIVHIDFGDCFEVAMLREKFPEKIPFRLTRMMINAMESYTTGGIEGTYRFTSECVQYILRSHANIVMAMLEAFVYDPLINWQLFEAPKQQQTQQQGGTTATTQNGQPQQAQGVNANPQDPNIRLQPLAGLGVDEHGNKSSGIVPLVGLDSLSDTASFQNSPHTNSTFQSAASNSTPGQMPSLFGNDGASGQHHNDQMVKYEEINPDYDDEVKLEELMTQLQQQCNVITRALQHSQQLPLSHFITQHQQQLIQAQQAVSALYPNTSAATLPSAMSSFQSRHHPQQQSQNDQTNSAAAIARPIATSATSTLGSNTTQTIQQRYQSILHLTLDYYYYVCDTFSLSSNQNNLFKKNNTAVQIITRIDNKLKGLDFIPIKGIQAQLQWLQQKEELSHGKVPLHFIFFMQRLQESYIQQQQQQQQQQHGHSHSHSTTTSIASSNAGSNAYHKRQLFTQQLSLQQPINNTLTTASSTDYSGVGHPIFYGFYIQDKASHPSSSPSASAPSKGYPGGQIPFGPHNNHTNAQSTTNNTTPSHSTSLHSLSSHSLAQLRQMTNLPVALNLTPLSVEDQVSRLITEATSLEKLCQCYIGWCYYW